MGLLLILAGQKEEEGVMTVKFKDPIAARACVLKFNSTFPVSLDFARSPFLGWMIVYDWSGQAHTFFFFFFAGLFDATTLPDRYFAQRRIEAFLHDNRTKYRRSGVDGPGVEDEEELAKEEKARLEKFEEFLMQDSQDS